jgi:tetratricopeptide (TPR) repeat protein
MKTNSITAALTRKRLNRKALLPVVLGVLMLFASECAVSTYKQGLHYLYRNESGKAIEMFQKAELESPGDYLIKRDLGVAYYRNRQYSEAFEKLAQAKKMEPGDGKTMFYLGLSYEKKGMYDEAVAEYKQYVNITRSKNFKEILSIIIKQINKAQIDTAVAQSLAQEQTISADSIPPNSVAVLYFKNAGNVSNLDPLQKGITQMLITDLSKASKLTVVERVKLQHLLEELKLGSTGLVEPSQMPRVGKLIGASKLVNGGFTDLADQNLRIDVSLAEVATANVRDVEGITGKVMELFQLEKALVFKIIDELGVELTREEREAIQKFMTESLLAFLAYSKGLDFEDRRMFAEARAEYQRAVELDPNFELAKQSLDEIDIEQKAAENPSLDREKVEELFAASFDDPFRDARISRLVNTSFAAQTDTRSAAQEVTEGVIVPVIIPLPPTD